MRVSGIVAEARSKAVGRPLAARDWSVVVARHEQQDWPPPGWLRAPSEVHAPEQTFEAEKAA